MNFQPAVWRLIHTAPACGALNMAIDEAILQAVGRGEVPPTLRLYAWSPACLSLGYSQPFNDVRLEALRDYGWDLVRRPTGGRAILHCDELTYSVCGPPDEPRLVGGVLESYRTLSQALLNALLLLNIPARALARTGRAPGDLTPIVPPNPICFEAPSHYEIIIGGKKLLGSAQARRKEGVLQHGSLPLHGDLARITQVLNYPDETARQEAARNLLEHAVTVEAATGMLLTWAEVAQAFAEAFQQTLLIEFEYASLTGAEMALAVELFNQKYNHPAWTERI